MIISPFFNQFEKYSEIKRGYSRPSHLAAIDLRYGKISKKEAILIKKNFEGKRPPSLDLFLDFVGISEEEFLNIAISHQVSPNVHNSKKTRKGKKTKDFKLWSSDGKMNKKYSKKKINSFKNK